MKKVFGQTVRDLKREVNKKVLKVPGIEQKILDATSNESWGPHGSHLADIAQATRNFHEYQIIMTVIWRRINDTGKNWRHVFKALTVLEYLVAHGSERVIDEIREHAYQISTLSNFQYIDSGGRDQGSNVRRKSQSLVTLVNDKERLQEVRQKALANKDKNLSTSSTGSTYRSSTGGYGDRYDDQFEGRYGYRDDDRDTHEKGRDYSYKDDDRYGRGGDKYNRDDNRYGKDYEERYGREGYRDDDFRSYGSDDYRLGSRKSVDRYTDRSFDEDDRHSSRSGGGRADDHSLDDRRLEPQLSGQNVGAPPSYEEATKEAHNHIQNGRDGGTVASPAHQSSSPPVTKATSPSRSISQGPDHDVCVVSPEAPYKELDAFDEFDPRGSVSAAPPAAQNPELDFFGSLSASDSTNSLALLPVTPTTTTSAADMPTNSGFETNSAAPSTTSTVLSQPNENPFGDSPFKATPQENFPAQPQNYPPATSAPFGSTNPFPPQVETVPGFDFGDSLGGLTSYAPTAANGQHFSASHPGFSAPETSSSSDVLADLFPQTGSSGLVYSQAPTNLQTYQMDILPQSAVFPPQEAQPAGPYNLQSGHLNLLQQQGSSASASLPSQTYSNFYPHPAGLEAPNNMHLAHLNLQPPGTGIFPPAALNNNMLSAHVNLLQEPGLSMPLASQAARTTPSREKFEPKSAVWTDTLSRGLVDLNISGAKINPLADIGIDFDAINRKEKRKEVKSSAAPVASSNMGKAMGSGSGVGRASASGIAPPPNPMMGMGTGMGMGMGGGAGIGMGAGMGMGGGVRMGMGMSGYGQNMNQPPMGMGMGLNMGMGMGQGAQMGPPPGPGLSGIGYNPMMGMGNYDPQQAYGGGPQQPYGGGYR